MPQMKVSERVEKFTMKIKPDYNFSIRALQPSYR